MSNANEPESRDNLRDFLDKHDGVGCRANEQEAWAKGIRSAAELSALRPCSVCGCDKVRINRYNRMEYTCGH